MNRNTPRQARRHRRRLAVSALAAAALALTACGTRVPDTVAAGSGTGGVGAQADTGQGAGSGTDGLGGGTASGDAGTAAGASNGTVSGTGTGTGTAPGGAGGAFAGGSAGSTGPRPATGTTGSAPAGRAGTAPTGGRAASGSATGAGGASSSTRGTAAAPGKAAGGTGPAPGSVAPANAGPGDTSPIKIGASVPLSGVAGYAGGQVVGALDSYIQMTNASGGINGRQLQIITYDDHLDNSQQLQNVKRLVEQDHVNAVAVFFSDAIGEYTKARNVPVLSFGITPASFSSKYPNIFPFAGSALGWTGEWAYGLTQVKHVLGQGDKVAILYDTELLNIGAFLPYLKQIWQKAGLNVVTTDPWNLSSGDCTSLVLKMRQLNIDYWDFQTANFTACVSAAQRQGYRPAKGWGGWITSVGGSAVQAGPYIDGQWSGSGFMEPDGSPFGTAPSPEYNQFVGAVKRYHPDLSKYLDIESPIMPGFWVGAELFVNAAKSLGANVTPAGIVGYLQNVKNFNTGIGPPVGSFAPTCKTGNDGVWLGQWQWNNGDMRRKPATQVLPFPYKSDFGGDCYLTKTADTVVQ